MEQDVFNMAVKIFTLYSKLIFSNVDYIEINTELNNISWTDVLHDKDLNKIVDIFYSTHF